MEVIDTSDLPKYDTKIVIYGDNPGEKPHYIWCIFFGRCGLPCKMCDGLYEKYPMEEGVDLIKKYFPNVIVRK